MAPIGKFGAARISHDMNHSNLDATSTISSMPKTALNFHMMKKGLYSRVVTDSRNTRVVGREPSSCRYMTTATPKRERSLVHS